MDKSLQRNHFYLRVYILCSFARILTAPLIFWFPIPAIFLALFLDCIDGEIASCRVLTLSEYEQYDKALDFWWYANVIVFASHLFATNPLIKYSLIILFSYRLLGEVIFIFRNNRWILFVFPNLFEHFFLFFFVANYFPILWANPWFTLISITIVITKFIQEWWLHIAKFSLNEKLFHRKKNWLEEIV